MLTRHSLKSVWNPAYFSRLFLVKPAPLIPHKVSQAIGDLNKWWGLYPTYFLVRAHGYPVPRIDGNNSHNDFGHLVFIENVHGLAIGFIA